jgi:hypothetical protein
MPVNGPTIFLVHGFGSSVPRTQTEQSPAPGSDRSPRDARGLSFIATNIAKLPELLKGWRRAAWRSNLRCGASGGGRDARHPHRGKGAAA